MSKSIKPEELAGFIKEYLEEYREDIQEDVEEVTDKVTKEARDELKQTSPKGKIARNPKYYKGWSTKISKRGATKYHKVIWNKTNYQLTHLLEFGHKTRAKSSVSRDGTKRIKTETDAIPHIRPVEEKYKVEFVDLVEERIRRRSKKWH